MNRKQPGNLAPSTAKMWLRIAARDMDLDFSSRLARGCVTARLSTIVQHQLLMRQTTVGDTIVNIWIGRCPQRFNNPRQSTCSGCSKDG
jgi:hypothetical protein